MTKQTSKTIKALAIIIFAVVVFCAAIAANILFQASCEFICVHCTSQQIEQPTKHDWNALLDAVEK